MKLKKFDDYINEQELFEKAVTADDVYQTDPEKGVLIKKTKKRGLETVAVILFDFDDNKVMGMARAEKYSTDDVYISHRVLGIEKHGPLMLELMMSTICPFGIIPNRTINPGGIAMFTFFEQKRPDVIKTELSKDHYWYATEYSHNIKEEGLKDPAVLKMINKSYKFEKPIPKYQILVDRGESLMKKYNLHPNTIIEMAEKEFSQIYNAKL